MVEGVGWGEVQRKGGSDASTTLGGRAAPSVELKWRPSRKAVMDLLASCKGARKDQRGETWEGVRTSGGDGGVGRRVHTRAPMSPSSRERERE